VTIGRNTFIKKGYGRIYVMALPGQEANVTRVEQIVADLDAFEWSYYVKGLITAWDGKVKLIYSHKFEPCIDAITFACWQEGIAVWCISQHNEFFGELPEKTPVPKRGQVWRDSNGGKRVLSSVKADELIATDMSGWSYVCEQAHDDEDFSYMCFASSCRCQS